MKHYNPSIVERAQRIFNTKGDNLPDEVSGPVAVIPIQPVSRIIKAAAASNTSIITPYTTPTDKDFYLTGVTLSFVKDAANDLATGSLLVQTTVNGETVSVTGIAVLTLTAQQQTVRCEFNPPIKVDRNAAIQLPTATFTAGAMRRVLCINGYTEEVTAN